MNGRPAKITILAGSALAAILLGGGFAYAATGTSAAPAHAVTHLTGTTATSTVNSQTNSNVNDTTGADTAAESSTESATEPTGAGETATPETASDGPGGHADPTGSNVDHQFNGNE
ncbi:MAG: hypothetical protein JWO57_1712 [Pseudonocardiales bacterium]|nr:hypothetical protein [Pseudonocardiales bacterium]